MKVKRWTWEEWNKEGLGKVRWVNEAFNANEPYITHLEADNKRYREVLEFYADTENWYINSFTKADIAEYQGRTDGKDWCAGKGGKLARKALEPRGKR